jgi:hypothetical protein
LWCKNSLTTHASCLAFKGSIYLHYNQRCECCVPSISSSPASSLVAQASPRRRHGPKSPSSNIPSLVSVRASARITLSLTAGKEKQPKNARLDFGVEEERNAARLAEASLGRGWPLELVKPTTPRTISRAGLGNFLDIRAQEEREKGKLSRCAKW